MEDIPLSTVITNQPTSFVNHHTNGLEAETTTGGQPGITRVRVHFHVTCGRGEGSFVRKLKYLYKCHALLEWLNDVTKSLFYM